MTKPYPKSKKTTNQNSAAELTIAVLQEELEADSRAHRQRDNNVSYVENNEVEVGDGPVYHVSNSMQAHHQP